MNDFTTLNLDEHAAFWARADERAGRASRRVEFELAGKPMIVRQREARFVRAANKNGRDCTHWFYEIEGSQALLISRSWVEKQHDMDAILGHHLTFRPFCAQPGSRYGAAIRPDGTGEWFYRTIDKVGNLGFLSQSPFRLAGQFSPTSFAQWSQTDFLASCIQQWDSPDSELRQSYEFARLSLAERDAQVLFCQHGDAAELRRLTHLLAHLIWSERIKAQLQLEGDFENVIGLDLQTGDLFYCREDEIRARFNRLQRAWREAILRVVAPRYVGKAAPLYIEHWLKQESVSLRVFVESPSHHEQLEAHLQLHEWAEQNLSPVKRKQLFDLSK